MSQITQKPKRTREPINRFPSASTAERKKVGTEETALVGKVDAVLPDHLVDAVDAAVAEAFSRRYTPDPLIPAKIASLRGPLDSVLRRHGLLIETAIASALEMNGSIEVMVQVPVPVSEAAIQLCRANAAELTEQLTIPVGTDVLKNVVLDIVGYYPSSGRLVVASVKRGGGAQGGSAARQDRIELRAAAMILRGLLVKNGRQVSDVEVVVIDFYGRSGIVAGRVVAGVELDSFFGVPVFGVVDAMTRRMADLVSEKVEERLALLDLAGPAPTPPARTAEQPDRLSVLAFPETGRGKPPTLAECFAALPPRPQGRQMAMVGPTSH